MSGNAETQHRVLEALEEARNYNAWVASLVQPFLGEDPLEIGSGTGTYAEIWLRTGLPRLTVTELDPELLARLERRFATDDRVSVQALDLTTAGEGTYSGVTAINVLEHIEDDAGAVAQLARLVRPGGRVVLFVPAFSWAMGDFDRAIGHYRRYTRAGLRAVLERGGLAVDDVRYVNAPGLPAWFVAVRLLRKAPAPGLALRVWDSCVVPAARAFETRVRPPFGQSVLAVGHAP